MVEFAALCEEENVRGDGCGSFVIGVGEFLSNFFMNSVHVYQMNNI